MIDLHTHSSASDGSFSPEALIEEASKRGLSALALTDHDTIAGLDIAKNAAARAGIAFIPGVELQINWRGMPQDGAKNGVSTAKTNASVNGTLQTGIDLHKGEFHLLGLGLSDPTPKFLGALEELRRLREKRNLEMLDKMNELGVEASYDEIIALSGGYLVGRPHFATLLTNRGIVKNQEQAFSLYLGPGKPFYVPKTGLEFEEAAALIKESGGIAVLAHPMSLYVAWGRLPELIKNLKDRGLDGIEAWHPTARRSACIRLEELGKTLGLIITAGSDFHGATRPDRKLGITAGGKKIDESFLEAIPALNHYRADSIS